MTLELELTAAELELIENKRKQDALEKEAELLKKEARIQKESIEIQNLILKEQKQADLQVAAATEYYNGLVKLNPKYKLEVTEREAKKEIKDYSGPETIVLKTFNYITKKAQIKLSDSPYYIDIENHFVYSKWRSENKGYKMALRGGGFYSERLVSNPKTLNQKIEDKLQDIKNKDEAKLKKASAVEFVFENLSNLYPDAEINKGTEWQRNIWDKKNGGETIDIINIKLSNGIKIKYKVYPDKTISRMEMLFPIKDSYQILELMNGLTITE